MTDFINSKGPLELIFYMIAKVPLWVVFLLLYIGRLDPFMFLIILVLQIFTRTYFSYLNSYKNLFDHLFDVFITNPVKILLVIASLFLVYPVVLIMANGTEIDALLLLAAGFIFLFYLVAVRPDDEGKKPSVSFLDRIYKFSLKLPVFIVTTVFWVHVIFFAKIPLLVFLSLTIIYFLYIYYDSSFGDEAYA